MQVCLALRYIHKEKHVVHRDLSPSNIMINEDDVVKLADFGLAKQRVGTNSVMESVVGTVLYQCPEIIQHESYSDKADIWSLGCVLYQMASLRPPFEGGNPLVVASKIVEGNYPPLADGCSALLRRVVTALLTPDPAARPDIEEVSRLISPVITDELDRVSQLAYALRTEVRVERDVRQRHEREASRNKETVHRLFARQRLDAPINGERRSARELGDGSPLKRSAGREARSPMLSISMNRIREINDPCSRILNQLHKILFVSQLPPTTSLSFERAIVEKYKHALFSHRNHYRGWNLKDELNKVLSGSQETIDLTFCYAEGAGADAAKGQRITYEELQRATEQVLSETGYYVPAGDSAAEPRESHGEPSTPS